MARRTPSFTPLLALAVAIFSGAYFTLTRGNIPSVSIPGVTINGHANPAGGNRSSGNTGGQSGGFGQTGYFPSTAPPLAPNGEATTATVATGRSEISVYFSPKGGCTEACVHEIQAARQTILVQAYSFTSAPIAQALRDAHQRGVKVTVVLDKSQRSEHYTEADFVAHAGIPTYIDAKHAIAHNKIMLIDGHTIITGSFNFTSAAESSNAENMLVMHEMPQLFAAYEQNFEHHKAHSELFTGHENVNEPDGTTAATKSRNGR